MANIELAVKEMFEAKTWESFIAVINEILNYIFGFIADDQGWTAE